jgi:hypothetical protein
VCRTASLKVIIVNNNTLVASNNMNLTAVVARIINGSRKLFNRFLNFVSLKFEFFRNLTKWLQKINDQGISLIFCSSDIHKGHDTH